MRKSFKSAGFTFINTLLFISVITIVGYLGYRNRSILSQIIGRNRITETASTYNLKELKNKLTPEIRECIISKLGKTEALRLLQETKDAKSIPTKAREVLRICLPESVKNVPPPSEPQNYPVLPGFPALQKLDTSNLIAYQIWLNYYAQNPENGSNSDNVFINAASHLSELADMGITMIQLSPFHPFLKQTTIGSPYGSLDFYDVNPGYATGDKSARIQSLKEYIDQAHSKNIKVIMDCVYHSTDPKNVLITSHPEYYQRNFLGQISKNRYGFAVLDFNNPETRNYMINMVKYWEQTVGIDGCRADVAIYIPLSFWAMLNNEIKKIKPEWFMVAETSTKLQEYGATYSGPGYHLQETYQNVYGFDAVYGVDSMIVLRKIINNNAFADNLQKAWLYPEQEKIPASAGTIFYRAIDNHDQRPRAVSLAGGNPGMIASMVINFTLDGIPFIFNGQEIGDTAQTSIPIQRYISWNNPPQPENKSIIRQLINLRKAHPALKMGSTVWHTTSNPNQIISYVRQYGNEKILVSVNMSPSQWTGSTISPPGQTLIGTATNLLTGQTTSTQPINNTLSLSLGPYGYLIAQIE